jgi:replicative DNA helicase
MQVGIPQLDKQLNFQRGRLYSILGSPGSGKTSLALNMINHTSKNSYHSMFFSFDMSQYDVIQKLTQRHTGMKRDELYDIYTSDNNAEIEKVDAILQDNYANVSFVFKTGQSIDEIKESIIKREQLLGIDIPLIIVDYLELVQSKFSDPTQASAEVIQGLREIAINTNKIVIVLLQPNKMSSTVDQPITSYNAAKGSASVAQAVTAMLTVHRPGYSSRTPEYDNYFSIDCVKNRTGQLFHVDLAWNGLRGTLRELEEIEAQELQELLQRKREQQGDGGLFS